MNLMPINIYIWNKFSFFFWSGKQKRIQNTETSCSSHFILLLLYWCAMTFNIGMMTQLQYKLTFIYGHYRVTIKHFMCFYKSNINVQHQSHCINSIFEITILSNIYKEYQSISTAVTACSLEIKASSSSYHYCHNTSLTSSLVGWDLSRILNPLLGAPKPPINSPVHAIYEEEGPSCVSQWSGKYANKLDWSFLTKQQKGSSDWWCRFRKTP